MPSTSLRTRVEAGDSTQTASNALPLLLHTPSGLAILEIQGTIHAPFPDQVDDDNDADANIPTTTPIGRLEFPFYDPAADPSDTKWMKRVYLYVGRYQRLTGEVKKLPKALVAIGKREQIAAPTDDNDAMEVDEPPLAHNELEVLEVIRHKILFGGRPEPVGD